MRVNSGTTRTPPGHRDKAQNSGTVPAIPGRLATMRLEVALGDGHELEAIGRGVVVLETKLLSGRVKKCTLNDVLYVPKLAYNLLSVSKVTEASKTTRFGVANCQILDGNRKLIAVGAKVGDLYYLNCHNGLQQTNMAQSESQKKKEDVWHQRFGHLGARNLEKLAKDKLVDGSTMMCRKKSISANHVQKESIISN